MWENANAASHNKELDLLAQSQPSALAMAHQPSCWAHDRAAHHDFGAGLADLRTNKKKVVATFFTTELACPISLRWFLPPRIHCNLDLQGMLLSVKEVYWISVHFFWSLKIPKIKSLTQALNGLKYDSTNFDARKLLLVFQDIHARLFKINTDSLSVIWVCQALARMSQEVQLVARRHTLPLRKD